MTFFKDVFWTELRAAPPHRKAPVSALPLIETVDNRVACRFTRVTNDVDFRRVVKERQVQAP
jgi:hypothetical protein